MFFYNMNWIISLGFFILLISMISIILPEGKTGKYIKSIFSLFVLFVALRPIIDLKNSNVDFSFSVQNKYVFLQESYLEYVFELKKTSLQNDCIKIINDKNIKDPSVEIYYEISDMEFIIQHVKIILTNAVINSDKENISIIDEIKNDIATYLNINNTQLEIYE